MAGLLVVVYDKCGVVSGRVVFLENNSPGLEDSLYRPGVQVESCGELVAAFALAGQAGDSVVSVLEEGVIVAGFEDAT